jgi:HD-GYP domain-containing protein (c-di-GMP phosphodiesterase class II)
MKPDALDEDEWELMRQHPIIGARLVEQIEFLHGAIPLIRHHHERWDGDGYPDGLSGADIPLGARAFAIADTLDAITSDRPYRAAQPLSVARDVMRSESGSQFDPELVSVFAQISDSQLRAVKEKPADMQCGMPVESRYART